MSEERKVVTQEDIRRGIRSGTSSRVLISEISEAIRNVRRRPQVVPGKAEETWLDLTEEIAERDRNKQRGQR